MTCASAQRSSVPRRCGSSTSLVGPPTHLNRHYGLDAPGILARIRKVTAGRAEQAGGERG
jgi:hypothetical protein